VQDPLQGRHPPFGEERPGAAALANEDARLVEMGLKSTNVDQAKKGWRIVDRNLEKIYNLTMNLLAYSKSRKPALELVNPKTLINECIELIAPLANEKGAMVVADVDKDVPAVPLDVDGIHQVLVNLLTNAIDAVEPQKGLIKVSCRYEGDEKQSVIDVIDNGVGISPNLMKHLFELFHSAKAIRHGHRPGRDSRREHEAHFG
jgi:signal transduction histidine kinase